MERESTLHSPREDDDLAREVEGLVRGAPVQPRARADRAQEDPAEDTAVEAGLRPDVAAAGVLDERDVEERAELARLLTGLHYPATREDAAEVAQSNGADDPVLGRLRQLPAGRFEVFEAIWEALGGQPD